jgi:hypothetical protein
MIFLREEKQVKFVFKITFYTFRTGWMSNPTTDEYELNLLSRRHHMMDAS